MPPSRFRASRFNPRSRVGSDRDRVCLLRIGIVSIHAPAWGATAGHEQSDGRRDRFNPRSRVGSDTRMSRSAASTSSFQSTLPRGERLDRVPLTGARLAVSIHAPAWGATRCAPSNQGLETSFNPRSRVGSDDSFVYFRGFLALFQSTLPRGERLSMIWITVSQ